MTDTNLLEKLASIATGSKFANFLEIKFMEAKEGFFKCFIKVKEDFCNSYGNCHGGAIAGMIDTIGGAVTHTVINQDSEFFTTTNIRVDYLEVANLGENLTGEGRVLRKGSRLILVEIKLFNEKNDIVAFGITSNLILKKK